MSSFLGGFARSLQGSLAAQQQRTQEKYDLEWKIKKTQELEAAQRKKTIDPSKAQVTKGPDGKWVKQNYNLDGEPFGPPTSASPGDIRREEERLAGIGREEGTYEANIARAQEDTALARAKREEIPYERARADKQADAYVTQSSIGLIGADAKRARSAYEGKLIKKLEETGDLTTQEWRALEGQEAPSSKPYASSSTGSAYDKEEEGKVLKEVSELTQALRDAKVPESDIQSALASGDPFKQRLALRILELRAPSDSGNNPYGRQSPIR